MDYFNFIAEYQGLFSYIEKNNKILSNLNEYFNNYCKMKEQALNTMKKFLEHLLLEINKPLSASFDINPLFGSQKTIKDFISILNVTLDNEINQNNKLQTDIIGQMKDYINYINIKNNSILKDFKSLMDKVYYQKKEYEKSKNEYINYGKQLTIFENQVSEKMNNNLNYSFSYNINVNDLIDSDLEEAKLGDNLKQLKKNFRKSEKKYKEIIEDTNSLYLAKNEEYFKILKNFIEIEESKENFFKCYLEKYNHYRKNNLEMLNTINEYSSSIIKKIYDAKNNKEFFKNNVNIFLMDDQKRLKQEIFVDYEDYKLQLCDMANKNRMFLKEDRNANSSINLEEILNKEYKVENIFFNQDEKLLIEQIFLIEDIDNFKFGQFCSNIKNDIKYARNFIDIISEKYNNSIGIQITNENNFIKLEKILNSILLNNNVQKKYFELNSIIVYISEKTFYQDDKNSFYKLYLCKLLIDDNPIVKTKQFWIKLIKLKILSNLENKANKETKKILKEEKMMEEKEKGNLNSTFTYDYKPSLFDFAGSMVNNLWNGKTIDDKQKDEIRKQEIYNAIYQSKSKEVCLKVLSEFAKHFLLFCLNKNEIDNIIDEIINEYQIKGEEKKIEYLKSKINSNMYSIKNSKLYHLNKENNRNNKNIKHLNKFLNKNYLKKKIDKSNQSLIILNLMKYLPFEDYINILKINKATYQLISRILYKNVLINIDENFPEESKVPKVWKNPKLRLTIWKLLLHFKKVNYDELVKNIDKNSIQCINIIDLDTKRMSYSGNKDSKEIKPILDNILTCLSGCHPQINYSQGMNYIAYLLYEICGSEEEAFQIFNSLLTSTPYGDLFFNELLVLNKYFYVFDRLVFIYLPEIYEHLKNNDISAKLFVTPWFITLFCNSYKNNKDMKNPKVLIWILDLFIIYGWKSIIKIGICLMKHFEAKILSYDSEELLHFLISDVLKDDFFQNENYFNLRNIFDELKIGKSLIQNIEKEYELKH